MIIYHGSFVEIEKPDLVHSRLNVDFGCGFYATPLYEQAAKWCSKFKRRGKDGIISRYEYDEKREVELKTLKFDSYSEEWLDFILNCRSGKDSTNYDLIVGGVANDKVFNTVELFFDGLIDKAEAINRLRYEKPNLQICFRTEKALSLLNFEGSETLRQRIRFCFKKNIAVLLSTLPNSRDFHWMRHWISFIIPRFIS